MGSAIAEFCYYFFLNEQGSLSDFKGPGVGQGECIKNNAESVWNRSSHTVIVFFNSNFGGVSQSIAPGARVDLDSSLIDNNGSHEFV